jgi:hypothetical protein
VPLIDPGDGSDAERPTEDDVGKAVDEAAVERRLIGTLDGGVSRRLVRRCRTAAGVLLATGAALLLVLPVAPSGAISALLILSAGTVLVGSVLLLRRGTLWTEAARSVLPGSAGTVLSGSALPQLRDSVQSRASSYAIPGASAVIGPPRLLSPGLASAPVKRRLGSAVVPLYVDDGPSPGDGALVVHARADGIVLTEGDTVLVWRAGTGGLASLPRAAEGTPPVGSVRGRFVLCRESDAEVFLATTRLADTW